MRKAVRPSLMGLFVTTDRIRSRHAIQLIM